MYLAFDNDTGREVAWNVISFARLKRHERKRIDDEIQIAKSLDHPRILRFINAWINKEKAEVIFITERVTGGSLRQYINRLDGPLKLKVIRNWCRQILEGIVYLHTQPHPVIHRDLKCDNIFVNGNDGKVLIGDLGLSTALRAASCATSIVGTPEFMAPELYEEKYGPSVDIYAFGMCLLEMVTRRFPYSECSTAGQIYKKVISGEPPRVLARVKDAALRALIESCVGIDPAVRPTAEELLANPYWGASEDGDTLAEVIEEESETVEEERPVEIVKPRGLSRDIVIQKNKREPSFDRSSDVDGPVKGSPGRSSLPERPLLSPPRPSNDLIELTNIHQHAAPQWAPGRTVEYRPPSKDSLEELSSIEIEKICRNMEIAQLDQVHMVVEVTPGVRHGVRFDFAVGSDSAEGVARELRDAGLVWQGVDEIDLVRMVHRALHLRLQEISSERKIHYSESEGTAFGSIPLTPSELLSQPTAPVDLLSGEELFEPVGPVLNLPKYQFQGLSEELCGHLLPDPFAGLIADSVYPEKPITPTGLTPPAGSLTPLQFFPNSATGTPSLPHLTDYHPIPEAPPHREGQSASREDVNILHSLLLAVGKTGDFIPGCFCAATVNAVKEFQEKYGLEATGFVSDRTWKSLVEQAEIRRKKEEERVAKREEARHKAKLETEKKFLQQQADSAKALDSIMEKTLTSMGLTPGASVALTQRVENRSFSLNATESTTSGVLHPPGPVADMFPSEDTKNDPFGEFIGP